MLCQHDAQQTWRTSRLGLAFSYGLGQGNQIKDRLSAQGRRVRCAGLGTIPVFKPSINVSVCDVLSAVSRPNSDHVFTFRNRPRPVLGSAAAIRHFSSSCPDCFIYLGVLVPSSPGLFAFIAEPLTGPSPWLLSCLPCTAQLHLPSISKRTSWPAHYYKFPLHPLAHSPLLSSSPASISISPARFTRIHHRNHHRYHHDNHHKQAVSTTFFLLVFDHSVCPLPLSAHTPLVLPEIHAFLGQDLGAQFAA